MHNAYCLYRGILELLQDRDVHPVTNLPYIVFTLSTAEGTCFVISQKQYCPGFI